MFVSTFEGAPIATLRSLREWFDKHGHKLDNADVSQSMAVAFNERTLVIIVVYDTLDGKECL